MHHTASVPHAAATLTQSYRAPFRALARPCHDRPPRHDACPAHCVVCARQHSRAVAAASRVASSFASTPPSPLPSSPSANARVRTASPTLQTKRAATDGAAAARQSPLSEPRSPAGGRAPVLSISRTLDSCAPNLVLGALNKPRHRYVPRRRAREEC
eukprot:1380232-Pleurochrysis_carterae.AAC.1